MSKSTQNPTQRYDDEISLYELYCVLVEKKIIFVTTVLVVLVAAVIYLTITIPTFEAKVRLYAPKTNPLSLSVPDHPETQFDAGKVFLDYQTYLRSMELWRRFVEAKPDLFPKEARERLVIQIDVHPMRIGKDKDFSAEHIDIAYQHDTGAGAARILGEYLQFVSDRFVSDTISLVKDKVERQRENISAEIDSVRQKAHLLRQDEIDRLRHDLSLAEKLGITENMPMRSGSAAGSGGDVTFVAANENIRGYLRGTKALNAELEALVKRKSDDPYITGLREKQIEIELLNELQITTSRFRTYEQDGDIAVPVNPVKPSKGKLLALSMILGAILGVLLVFLVNSIQRARADHAAA